MDFYATKNDTGGGDKDSLRGALANTSTTLYTQTTISAVLGAAAFLSFCVCPYAGLFNLCH